MVESRGTPPFTILYARDRLHCASSQDELPLLFAGILVFTPTPSHTHTRTHTVSLAQCTHSHALTHTQTLPLAPTYLDDRESPVDMQVGGDILARKGIRGRSTVEMDNDIFSRIVDPAFHGMSNEDKELYEMDEDMDGLENDSSKILFVWPLPKVVVSGPAGGMVSIDPEFSIKSQSPSKILSAGIARYEALIKKRAYPMDLKGCQKPGVRHITIILESDGEDLNLDTSYHYSLMISGETGITIHAASPYGAL